MVTPFVTQIPPDDPQVSSLLKEEGIRLDSHIDYTCGLYDGGQLVATGSCFQNTLRCLAVHHSYQGEGLMNQIVSHLMEVQIERGNAHLFLYTKPDAAPFFSTLGFYGIAQVEQELVFMENRCCGFSSYLQKLQKETQAFCDNRGLSLSSGKTAAIVMNANPFTLGHQYLVEKAGTENDLVHLFVVREDSSAFPFSVRRELVQKGTAHLPNVCCHDNGSYLISNATFPSYFQKDGDSVITGHVKLDIALFARIAEALHVSARYLGEEPTSHVTGIYNEWMSALLPEQGIACRILPRRKVTEIPASTQDGMPGTPDRLADLPVSASTVRLALKENHPGLLEKLVPECTRIYLSSPEARPVIERLRTSEEVVHY